MKKFAKRAAALGLALVMTASTVLASEAMGSELRGGSVPLSPGTALNNTVFWSDSYSDLRNERFTTYSPNRDVKPTVAYGDKVLSRGTLTAMAKSLESQGRRVVSGINGDYYVLATGAPLGMVVTDGVLRSSSSWHLAVGFREDGSAFIGTPSLSVSAVFGGKAYAVTGGINKVRKLYTATDNTGGLVLLTSDFSDTTQNTEAGVDVVLTPVVDNAGQEVTGIGGGTLTQSEQFTINGRVTCTVDQVLESKGSVSIPQGKIIMSLNAKDNADNLAALRALKPGDTVDLEVSSSDTRWNEATQAVGAMYKLVTGGVVEQPNGSSAKSAWAERTARTAVGIKEDGTVVFYTVDGRQSGYSVGATLTQVAMRLVELGCVEAVSLDGGGSTTIGATLPGGSSMEIQNKPSDGSPRANSVAVFLTTDLQPTGELGSFYVTPSDSLLLAGASVQLTATALDTAYYPMQSAADVSYFIYSGDGTVSTEGVFTAGSESGRSQVTASNNLASGVADIAVVKTPDAITVANEATGKAVTSINLSPGQKIDLKASSTYKNMALTSQDACYTWTADPGVGTVDAEGVFTASNASGSGKITVSAGGRSVSVPVSVAGHVKALETFEGGVSAFTDTISAKATVETGMDYVRYGSQSMRLDYDAAQTGTAGLAASLSVPEGETHLGLWVYGDNSGNTLTATVVDTAGASSSVVVTALDFTGWKHVNAALGANTSAVQAFNLVFGGTEGKQAGTIWLDHLTTSNQDLIDNTPPTVKLTRSGSQLTAVVTDDVDKSFLAGSVVCTYDGQVITGAWDAATGILTAALPAGDGRAHRVTVTAVDASGNLGRASLDVEAASGSSNVFTDMSNHWAAPYATFLYNKGVTSSVDPDVLRFAPDRNITRGEFFAMTARWMGLNLADYAGVELPFADAAEIPGWALNEIKAMYSLGILKGSESGAGLKVNAGANISRAEAMTILGRTQPKGYAENGLTFTDAADVPDWALPYVRSLVSQGVVNGTDNRINPNKSITRGEVAKLLYAML